MTENQVTENIGWIFAYAGFHASGKSCGQNGPKFIREASKLKNVTKSGKKL